MIPILIAVTLGLLALILIGVFVLACMFFREVWRG